MTERFKRIGFNPGPCSELIYLFQDMLVVAEDFLVRANETRANFSVLFRWFQSTMRQLSGLEVSARMKLCSQDTSRLTHFVREACTDAGQEDMAYAFGKPIYDVSCSLKERRRGKLGAEFKSDIAANSESN